MLRVVFAVLLAGAILGVSLPAVETATIERSAAIVESDLDAFDAAARDLVDTGDPALRPADAARRTVAVDVPRGGPATAPVAFVAIGGTPNRSTSMEEAPGTTLAYHVSGTTHVRWIPITVRVLGPDGAILPPGEPLVLRGSHQVTLLLLEGRDGPVVVVSDGPPDGGWGIWDSKPDSGRGIWDGESSGWRIRDSKPDGGWIRNGESGDR